MFRNSDHYYCGEKVVQLLVVCGVLAWRMGVVEGRGSWWREAIVLLKTCQQVVKIITVFQSSESS